MPSRPARLRLTGPATRASAREAGLGDWRLRHPGIRRLSRDTYLPEALCGDTVARLAAVLMTSPAGTLASHRTAAALWELDIPLESQDAGRRIDVIVPLGSAAGSRADRRVHRVPVELDEVTHRWAQPVTTPARTWRDLAGVLELPPLLAVTDQLLAGLCSAADLEQQLGRRPAGRGSARARAVLPVADRRSGSPMESVLRWLLHEADLPRPTPQYEIRDGAGFVGRVDLAWPERRVLVEFDGDVHRQRDVFVNDLRRQNRLVAAGWTVLRFTSADVRGRPAEVVAAIAAALR